MRNEPRLDQYLCLVLMTELLFGAQKLNGKSKPVTCILGYESKFREILNDISNDPTINIEQQIGTKIYISLFFLISEWLLTKRK